MPPPALFYGAVKMREWK